MSKYTEELKKQIVLEHKIKHYGPRVLQRKYGIPRSLIRQWIAQYELNGKFTEPARRFSGEFKLKVLNYQQEHNLSNLATALIFGITNQGTICACILPVVQKLCFRNKAGVQKCQRKV